MVRDAPLLALEHLSVEFAARGCPVQAVNDVSLELVGGETLGIIGESGSGKTATAMSVLRLLPEPPARIVNGRILLEGEDILQADPRRLREIRGREISMIFQDPATSLHPSFTVGAQLSEAIRVHDSTVSASQAQTRVIELLESVGIAYASDRFGQYPHQFSGGMRQRCMIAMAIANQPKVIIADEPTTALDVTIQAEILNLLRVVKRDTDAAIIFITHDLRVVAQIADHVAVMYAGAVVESGPVGEVFQDPQHPYTAALLRSLPALDDRADRQISIQGTPPDPSDLPAGCAFAPRCDVARGRDICLSSRPHLLQVADGRRSACHFAAEVQGIPVNLTRHTMADQALATAEPEDREAVLQVRGLTKSFTLGGRALARKKREILAVDDVSFDVHRGKTLALVGESGSGKSTIARLLLRLHDPTKGSILFDGLDLATADGRTLREARRRIQMVFQDPFGSLNPRLSARELVAEPLRIQGLWDSSTPGLVDGLLDRVGLHGSQFDRRPKDFSGGQRQRIAVARALVLAPEVLVLDEAVSALDVSIQAQVLNLLADLQEERKLTYLFISHDLAVIRQLADTIAVMFAGRIVEAGEAKDVYRSARHPYTRSLLAAIPGADPSHREEEGRVESAEAVVEVAETGCAFRLRCPIAADICASQRPGLDPIEGTHHAIACHFGDLPTPVAMR